MGDKMKIFQSIFKWLKAKRELEKRKEIAIEAADERWRQAAEKAANDLSYAKKQIRKWKAISL